MNKTELIAEIACKTGLSKKDAEKALNSVVEVITDALTNGDKVQIVGFGSFEVKDRPERVARNPQAPDQEITIAAGENTVTFMNYRTTEVLTIIKKLAPGSTGSVSGIQFRIYGQGSKNEVETVSFTIEAPSAKENGKCYRYYEGL